MKIRIFDSAKLDLLDGCEFYDQQERGIGRHFLDSIYADIDSLALYAGIHWLLSKSFPYAIYYSVEGDWVSVHAIMDCRQNPLKIEERLEKERTRRWLP